MSFDWRTLPLARLRGSLALLFTITFLAAAGMSLGAGLLVRAESDAQRIPDGARYYVVARAVDAGEVAEALATRPHVEVEARRRAGEILASVGAEAVGPEHLTVFEVVVPTEASVDLAGIDGAIDVIDVNAVERGEFTSARVARGAIVGGMLLVLGCVVFVWAVVGCTQTAGRECQDMIGVRVLLGAEAEGIWAPLGLVVGGVALSGGLASFGVTAFAVRSELGAASFPLLWAFAGGVALLFGTLALSFGAARRAVARAARATVLAALVGAMLLTPTLPAGAVPSPQSGGGPVRDADILRALSRDLAVCRRAVHVAKKGIATTEYQAVVAAARANDALVRIAAAKRVEELAALARAQERCAALAEEREHLRDVLESTRLFGPPITPRQPPVQGPVAVRYGQAGRRPGTHAFRGGVAMRTRGGESVRATAGGRVAYAGDLPGSGSVVVIDHGRRTYSVYAKIGSSVVEVGEEVNAGQTVARAETGLLYFSIRRRGRAIDPLDWVREAPKG